MRFVRGGEREKERNDRDRGEKVEKKEKKERFEVHIVPFTG